MMSLPPFFMAQALLSGSLTAAPAPTAVAFRDMHLGLFVHYTHAGRPYPPGCTTWSDGSPVASLDELADNLDVADLARVAASMRAQYLQLTAWHANMNALYPSAVLARQLPGHCARRDVIRDLLEALRPTGVRLILYLHPSDGDDFSREDQDRVGWNDGPPYTRWNDFINEVYAEVVARYGKEVAGYWIDGGLPQQVDKPRLRQTILSRQPGAWLIQNSGLDHELVDFGAHETFADPYPATAWQMNACLSGTWWANQSFLHISPELALKYTVLQASVPGGAGGVAWSVGCHPGGRWEVGVREFGQRLGQYVDRIAPALFGTAPSVAYPTPDGTPLRQARYAAMQSPDGAGTYLHVLWPPPGSTLTLPPPADGRRFTAAHLLQPARRAVTLAQGPDGVHLELPAGQRWDMVDTVIVLR
jgi:hypothetical protein